MRMLSAKKPRCYPRLPNSIFKINKNIYIKKIIETFLRIIEYFEKLFLEVLNNSLWLNWFITHKPSDTSETLVEIRSSLLAVFCKNGILWNFKKFLRKASVMESLYGKTASPHSYKCTKKDVITGVFLWIYLYMFFHYFISVLRCFATQANFATSTENNWISLYLSCRP